MIGKFYITNDQDGWVLAEFDYSKHPSTKIVGGPHSGCYNSPDGWNESPDPEDGALLFDTEADAQKIVDLMEGDPINESMKCFILKVSAPITKTITLSESQLASLVSTLECTIRRSYSYGSFGDGDTDFDYYAIEKTISQLKQ